MIIFGGRLFGKVDDVPGLFYVATKFFHVNFVPLLPMSSWLILHGSEKSGFMRSSWQGTRLHSIRWGSVAMAWLRLGLFAAAVAFALIALVGRQGPSASSAALPAVLAVGAAGALFVSYRISRATSDSLRKLASDAGVPADLVQRARAELENRKGPSQLVR